MTEEETTRISLISGEAAMAHISSFRQVDKSGGAGLMWNRRAAELRYFIWSLPV